MGGEREKETVEVGMEGIFHPSFNKTAILYVLLYAYVNIILSSILLFLETIVVLPIIRMSPPV